jgi:hypothetical protein
MPTIEEKRVYADRTGQSEVYVASEAGVVVVTVSDDLVGEFSLARRCDPRDVAAAGGQVAVATAEDVLAISGESLAPTGFGPAVAVDVVDDPEGTELVVADENGAIARGPIPEDWASAADESASAPEDSTSTDRTGEATASQAATAGIEWSAVGTVEPPVNAIEWPFVATDAGLFRVQEGMRDAGLTNVNDVVAVGMPLAATDDGLYKLGNGWMELLGGAFHAVASDGRVAHAADGTTLYACDDPIDRDADWEAVEVPGTEPVQDVAYTPSATVCATGAGTMLLTAGDGWRSRTLGVGGVVGIAVR